MQIGLELENEEGTVVKLTSFKSSLDSFLNPEDEDEDISPITAKDAMYGPNVTKIKANLIETLDGKQVNASYTERLNPHQYVLENLTLQ